MFARSLFFLFKEYYLGKTPTHAGRLFLQARQEGCEGVGPNPHSRRGLEFLEWTGARMALFWERELKNYPWNYVCIVNRLFIGAHVYWG